MRGYDRERHDRLAGPAGERPYRKGPFGWQENELRWHGRELVPVPSAHHCQPHMGEDPGRLDPAVLTYPPRCGGHVRVAGVVAGQAEGNVGLDGCRKLARPAMERRPGPVAALLRADPVGGAGQRPLVQDAKEVAEQDVLCVHGHVGLELALPPALGLLASLEVLARQPQGLGSIPFDDLGARVGDCNVGDCHVARGFDRRARSACDLWVVREQGHDSRSTA